MNSVNTKQIIFFILVFLTHVTGLFPQTYPFRNYGKSDGLPGTKILCLYQDDKSFLWLGTDNGLSRFDGNNFHIPVQKYEGSNHMVQVIFQDNQRNFWIGSQKGGVRCINSHGKEKNLPALENKITRSICQDTHNNIWFGTNDGLFCYDGENFSTYTIGEGLPDDTIFKAAVDKEKRLWVATLKGICYLQENRFIELKLPHGYRKSGFSTLLASHTGKVWIGTPTGLLCWQKGKFIPFPAKNKLKDIHITSLLEDKKGNILLGTWNGLIILSGESHTVITTENGLADNFIYALLEDREGNIWIATHCGLSCLRSLNIKSYSEKDGLPHGNIYDIIQDRKNRIWIGTANGLCCFHKGKFKIYKNRAGLANNSIHALAQDQNGKIRVGTLGGLSSFSSGKFKSYPQFKDIIFDLKVNRHGILWIGSSKGLFQMKDEKISPPPFKNFPYGVFFIHEDRKENLWFVSRWGLHKYSQGKMTLYSRQMLTLPSNHVRVIFEDSKGIIWIGSKKGLSSFRENNIITHYSKDDGLPDNTCNVILEDRDGNIWVGTENGLASYDGQTFRTYTSQRHGLKTDFWNTGTMDNKGNFWLGSQEGLIDFSPPPVRFNKVPPPVYINGVKVLGKDTPIARLESLNYKQNFIRIRFVGLSLSAPEALLYKFRLIGTDDVRDTASSGSRWQETQTPSVFYQYLPPGNYRFQVKAVNNDKIESLKPAEVVFRIGSPFWKTWWFNTLLFFSVIWITFMLVRLRFNLIRDKSELQTKNRQLMMAQRLELMGTLAAGSVHDLKNLLSIILNYTQLMSRSYTHNDSSNKYLDTIKNTAATAVHVSRQILSLARYPNDLPDVVNLGELMEEILETLKIIIPESIRLEYHKPENPVRLAISPAHFQQLVLNLCQNSVHAMPNGGNLSISLHQPLPNRIRLEVKDTGTGIEPVIKNQIFNPLFTTKKKGKGSGLGLFVVKQILEQHKGTVEVVSEPGSGTAFIIHFPV